MPIKVRSEIANKLRVTTQKDNAAAGKTVATAFGDALKGKDEISPKVPVKRQTERYHPVHKISHHDLPKNITVTQAKRLAQYAPIIMECSKKYNVPPELISGVILQESQGNAKAVSQAGAKGLMQLMPATAKRFGVTNIFDPRQNIEGGTKYLKFLMDRFGNDYRLVCAGYNAGEANVEKYGNKIPPFAETQGYVPKVLAYADTIYRMLRAPQVPGQGAAVAGATNGNPQKTQDVPQVASIAIHNKRA